MKSELLSREGRIIEKKSYPMTDTFEELLACMKDFHQMFKEDYELDGVAISSCGSIDVENAVIDAVWALPFLLFSYTNSAKLRLFLYFLTFLSFFLSYNRKERRKKGERKD